jgi:hypothetical protein
VFEDGLPAFEGEFPEAQAPAQGIPGLGVVIGSLLSCFHILLCVFGR